jgi:hypothetical protein
MCTDFTVERDEMALVADFSIDGETRFDMKVIDLRSPKFCASLPKPYDLFSLCIRLRGLRVNKETKTLSGCVEGSSKISIVPLPGVPFGCFKMQVTDKFIEKLDDVKEWETKHVHEVAERKFHAYTAKNKPWQSPRLNRYSEKDAGVFGTPTDFSDWHLASRKIRLPAVVSGTIRDGFVADDVDYFRFSAKKGMKFQVNRLYGNRHRVIVDVFIGQYAIGKGKVWKRVVDASSFRGGPGGPGRVLTAPVTQMYYLRVSPMTPSLNPNRKPQPYKLTVQFVGEDERLAAEEEE